MLIIAIETICHLSLVSELNLLNMINWKLLKYFVKMFIELNHRLLYILSIVFRIIITNHQV